MQQILQSIAQNPALQEKIAFGGLLLGVLLVERWLGKTNKVKAGSLLEAVQLVLIKIITKRG